MNIYIYIYIYIDSFSTLQLQISKRGYNSFLGMPYQIISTGRFKTRKIYTLTALKARSPKSRYQQGLVLSSSLCLLCVSVSFPLLKRTAVIWI